MPRGLTKDNILFRVFLAAVIICPSIVFGSDVERGEKVFRKCRSCHQVGANAKVKVGPPLNNVFGRVAGTYEGAKYSNAMKEAGANGLVWTEEILDQYLSKPRGLILTTNMTFSGLKKAQDRSDVLAYLKTFSDETDLAHTQNDPAVEPAVLALEGDAEYGEYLSGTCVTCHQLDGSDQGLPPITGWPEAAFVTVMHSYKNKHRENSVMQQLAGSLADEEIAALAAYFEGVK
jgi:cytochrome c